MKREITVGTLMRIFIVPTLALGGAYLFFRDSFAPEHFAALTAMFATPVAVSTVPMVQEMGSDTELAGQLVVWTTLFSVLSLVAVSFFFKEVGIF
jgi:predicted permease